MIFLAMWWRLFIKCLLCTYIYVARLYSGILIINHSAGLITSYHMLDAVVMRMFTPPAEVAFTNTNTNTISGVLCIADTFV